MIGLEVGEHPITVAAVYSGTSDAVEKILRVVVCLFMFSVKLRLVE